MLQSWFSIEPKLSTSLSGVKTPLRWFYVCTVNLQISKGEKIFLLFVDWWAERSLVFFFAIEPAWSSTVVTQTFTLHDKREEKSEFRVKSIEHVDFHWSSEPDIDPQLKAA